VEARVNRISLPISASLYTHSHLISTRVGQFVTAFKIKKNL